MDYGTVISEMMELASSVFVKNRIKAEFLPGSPAAISLSVEEAESYKWIADVTCEQHEDGSWGRFHSADSKIRRKWSTTESAMSRLKYLGLSRANLPVQKACRYCEALLNDISLWPDYMEKNNLFPKAIPIYITATLSHFGSDDPLYRRISDSLLLILHETFRKGEYDISVLNEKAKQHLGIETHDTYIGLNSKYLIIFLHNNVDRIDKSTQKRYLKWLHQQERIFYSSRTLIKPVTPLSSISFICERAEFLSYLTCYSGFSEEYAEDLSALSCLRTSDGLWDLGNGFKCPRLSENWLKPCNRKIDQTFYLLRLFHGVC